MTITIDDPTRAALALGAGAARIWADAGHAGGRRSRASADHGGHPDAAGTGAAAPGAAERPRRRAQGASTRGIDDQTALERKAFADGKVQMDAISGDIRIVREKVDETNVRLGSLSQELESLRAGDAASRALALPAAAAERPMRRCPTAPALPRLRSPRHPGRPRISPAAAVARRRTATTRRATTRSPFRASRSYLSVFPKSPQAHEAQLYIGEAYFQRQERRRSRQRPTIA